MCRIVTLLPKALVVLAMLGNSSRVYLEPERE